MSKEYLKQNAKGKLNKQLLLQDLSMLDKSNIKAFATSIARAPFPDNEKMSFKMLINFPKILSAMTTFFKSVKLINKYRVKDKEKSIDKDIFTNIVNILKKNSIDNIGYVKISGSEVFKQLAVPYSHVIIFTARQKKEPILTSPSIKSQVEVSRIYGVTGKAANDLSIYLDKSGYGAIPSHSMGGAIDYTKLGFWAGIGSIGRHGLLIEPLSGPNHRLGAVFTNISNLKDYFNNANEHLWINDFCQKCGKCIEKCPSKAIKEQPSVNENGYTTCIDYKKCGEVFGSQFGCNICVAVCPFTTAGYDKIKTGFMKNKE